MEKYFSGTELYGNSFSLKEIEDWYKDEEEAYANLSSGNKDNYLYGYENYNVISGFNKIKGTLNTNLSVLGLGSAYGDEFNPIVRSIEQITILDPSEQFVVNEFKGKPIIYVKPTVEGKMEFPNNSFDVITSFGTLHHIPNVEFIIDEMARVLKPGGYLLIREPIISMGDWRNPRNGLTSRERGIPFELMKNYILKNKLKIVLKKFCFSPISRRILKVIGIKQFNKKWFVRLDGLLSWVFSFRLIYHRTKKLDHLGPTNVFWVLQK